MGDAYMRGEIHMVCCLGGVCVQVVNGLVPLSEMFNYVSNLRGMTKGRAQYTMQLAKFEVVPMAIQTQISTKAQGATA